MRIGGENDKEEEEEEREKEIRLEEEICKNVWKREGHARDGKSGSSNSKEEECEKGGRT